MGSEMCIRDRFMKIETPELVEVEEISDTERSDGGFGHTGL